MRYPFTMNCMRRYMSESRGMVKCPVGPLTCARARPDRQHTKMAPTSGRMANLPVRNPVLILAEHKVDTFWRQPAEFSEQSFLSSQVPECPHVGQRQRET